MSQSKYNIIFLLLITIQLNSQIVIQPNISTSIHNVSELVDVQIINGLGKNVKGILEVSVLNEKNVTVIELISPILNVHAGNNTYSTNLYGQYKKLIKSGGVYSSIIALDEFPPGQYEVCYHFRGVDESNIVADYCESTVSETQNVINTLFPVQNSDVEDCSPSFEWESNSLSKNTRFYIQISEGKKCEDAFKKNVSQKFCSVLQVNGSTQTGMHNFNYEFKEGQYYAWSIKEIFDGKIIGLSEPSCFKYNCQEKTTRNLLPPSNGFSKMRTTIDEATNLHGTGVIKVAYYNHTGADSINTWKVHLLEFANQQMVMDGINFPKFPLKGGLNLISINTGTSLQAGNVYLLTITNTDKWNHYLLFKYN